MNNEYKETDRIKSVVFIKVSSFVSNPSSKIRIFYVIDARTVVNRAYNSKKGRPPEIFAYSPFKTVSLVQDRDLNVLVTLV